MLHGGRKLTYCYIKEESWHTVTWRKKADILLHKRKKVDILLHKGRKLTYCYIKGRKLTYCYIKGRKLTYCYMKEESWHTVTWRNIEDTYGIRPRGRTATTTVVRCDLKLHIYIVLFILINCDLRLFLFQPIIHVWKISVLCNRTAHMGATIHE